MEFMELYAHLITNDTIKILSISIAKKLGHKVPDRIEMDELVAWARLGLAKAMKSFDPNTVDRADDPQCWICGYLANKGFYEAIDEMRSAHVVSRFRNGKFYAQAPPARSFSEVESSTGSRIVIEEGDGGAGNPSRDVDVEDLLAVVTSRFDEVDRRIFDLRYRDGHKLRDIARMIGYPIESVYEIHGRLINRVRTYLRESGVVAA